MKNTTYIKNMSHEEKDIFLAFLKHSRDVLMDIFKDVEPGSCISMHHLAIEPNRCPVKQVHKSMHPDLASKFEAKVDKLVTANFVREVQYPV